MSEGERLAQKLAEDFSLERLKDFLFEKDFTVEESQPPIELKENLKESIRSIRQVADKKLDDVGNFNVYAIELKENITERSSKKRQFEIAKEILKAYQLTAGLFVFYPQEGKSFRFSLVFREPSGTSAEYSPYKRYTYFVSPELPNKTFIKQVGGCEFKDLKEIKSAFSVQPLTKDFYKEVQTWFYHAFENYEKEIFFPGGKKEENLIRLITRLMFVWFIKQMGLVPEKLFDQKELKNIVKDFGNGHNYYNAVLQNLFFATLNRPINERGWAKDEGFLKNRNTFGIKSLYRYEDKFLIPPEEVLGLFENIPFINGGLFECLDKDSQYIDGFSRRPDKQAKVPDKYFFQKEEQETDLSKYGLGKAKFRGLISIFKDYNWTTDESSPIDQEVALDPELLGKVFENLLASYNPETATTARKATGSYYTPKEVVDYMVEESLKEDFKTKTSLSEEKIENLFYQEEPQLSDEERKELVRAIADEKIIDPACGSGAFCMGALHKLVELLNRIDLDNELWKSEQQRRLTNELSERWEEMTQEERNEERAYLLEVFNEQRNYPDYGRKLYLIQNCIYGVDIQPIAVQLTKLRFFLSLILDQKPSNDKNNNFGILPLPHLETKFVCANTLIGLESSRRGSVGIIRTQEMMKIERELKRIRERYFRVRNRKQKQELEEKDRELREKLAELLKKQGWDNKDIQKIISFDILDPTAKADWFDPEWMFGVVDGFDIVIGNPPYVSTKGVDEGFKKVLQKFYGFSDDLYNHFYFKGIEILRENGILAFISSKTFWTIQTKKNLRELILDNKLLQLVDTANPFESSMVDTCITIVQKTIVQKTKAKDYEILFIDARNGLDKKEVYKVKDEVYKNVANNVFFIPTEFNLKIYEKLGKKVKELLDRWWSFISDSKKIDKYKEYLDDYRNSLKAGDITLLGLITEGGQGLATANNGKYIGVLEGTKWAEKVRKERPEKLWNFIKTKKPKELSNLKSKKDVEEYLNSLSEKEIRKLFDDLKEKYGRDIFGQGWLYRIVSKDEIADVDSLSDDEKLNGISGDKTFVPYDKGDRDGNRWWAPTPYYIDWSRENVRVLQTDPKARWQGYQFYFREGFCWTDVSYTIRSRIKEKSIHDVLSMSLFPITQKANEKYIVCLLNSKFMSIYLNAFVNTTVHFQINDARQLPIVIPTPEQLKEFELVFDRAKRIQEEKFSGKITEKEAEERLEEIQKELDEKVLKLYGLE
jgi:hypothetical protein